MPEVNVDVAELRQQWNECMRLLDGDRIQERKPQSSAYYRAQTAVMSLLWEAAPALLDAYERDQEVAPDAPNHVDLPAMLERGLRDYKAIDSTDPSGVSHLGLDDADYLALAARLAEVVAGHYESWDGLMSILDRHYPADVALLCDENSPDPGPRIVALIRHLARARKSEAEAVGLLRDLTEATTQYGPGSLRHLPQLLQALNKASDFLARRKEAPTEKPDLVTRFHQRLVDMDWMNRTSRHIAEVLAEVANHA